MGEARSPARSARVATLSLPPSTSMADYASSAVAGLSPHSTRSAASVRDLARHRLALLGSVSTAAMMVRAQRGRAAP